MMQQRQRQPRKKTGTASSTPLRSRLAAATAALCAMMKPTVISAEDQFFTRADNMAVSEQCTNLEWVTYPLHASDVDGNGVLSQSEFVQFTNMVSGGWLSDMGKDGDFLDMPLVLQEAQVVLACLCELYPDQPWGQPGCCDNTTDSGIRVAGAGPDDTPDEVQTQYLTYVCGTMSETLERLGAQVVAQPSSAPSGLPSASPSMKPTAQPVTASPTVSPTGSPSTLSPTKSPTIKPTMSPIVPIVPGAPTKTPTASPSSVPSESPSNAPSATPTLSTSPTSTPSLSSEPTTSSAPSISSAPTLFSGEFDLSLNFIQRNLKNVKASAIMEAKDNQFKRVMEESLKKLASEVIVQLKLNVAEEGKRRELMRSNFRRKLLVREAKNATVNDVQNVECPPGMQGDASPSCLAWDATITLVMEDENDPVARANQIRQAMLRALADGWLENPENFDMEEASKPPTDGTIDDETNPDANQQNKSLEPQKPISTGGIVGIALAALVLVLLVALFATHRAGRREDEATEERNAVKDSDTVTHDLEAAPTDDVSEVTETHSYASGAYLLQGQGDSSAGSALGKFTGDSEDDSFFDPSVAGEEEGGFSDKNKENADMQGASYLAAMGAASTLVASTSPRTPRTNQEESDVSDSEFEGAVSSAAVGASPVAASSGGSAGTPSGSSGEGLSTGAAAAIGGAAALTAGAIAAGAYVATKKDQEDDGEQNNEGESMDKDSISQMDELDVAIEAGDWGHVGALAAVLAAEGRRTPPQGVKSPRSIASGDASSRSRGASTGQSMDQARAAEIDKLVEAGDWQGVVLAAARFEADQTMDGESHSAASASRSSRWSGSSRGSASGTQRSFGTTDHSSTGAGRSQAEIRAEVEALVRRVVPEEADNIDEMLNQFKGREEELVETLRRMQERAIASRARLAVQKSAKLEARARASTPSASARSVASQGSSKDLEQAIEEGNWLAVGQAAQRISDQNESGDLSLEEKTRLRQKISQSPAMNQQALSNENVNLDELIEKGDWSGVIAAAKAASIGGNTGNTAGNISKEEQDALAQASMWQAIANQSKQDGGQDASGAGDAADWAISRSLNAMNTPGEQPTRTINDIADEESSNASQYESGSYGPSARSPDFKGSMV